MSMPTRGARGGRLWSFLLCACAAGFLHAAPAAGAPDFAVALDGPAHPRDDFGRAPDLGYRLPAVDAKLAERLAAWQALRIQSMDPRDWARRDRDWIKVTAQGRYYHNAGAAEAFDLYRQGQRARTQGLVWIAASPAVGAVVGGLAGAIVGLAQPADAYDRDGYHYTQQDSRTQHADVGLVIGAVVGGSIGFGVGYWQASAKRQQAHALRVRAAESFNRKLWQDLRINAAPLPGGAAVDLKARF